MKKNEIITIEINDYTHDGYGVGKTDDQVVFVPYVVKGETVKAKILKVKPGYAYAKLEEVIIESPNRVVSDCQSFSTCGACSFMHFNYQEELRFKKNKVEQTLKRIGNITCDVQNVLPSPTILNYRNKALIPVGVDKNGQVSKGFYKKYSHVIEPLNECLIQNPKIFEISNTIIDFIKKHNIAPYDEITGKGIVRHLFIRCAVKTNQIMVGVITNGNTLPYKEELIKMLLENHPEIASIIHNVNNQKGNIILGEKSEVIYGEKTITDEINGIKFKIGFGSFYQVNPYQTENLYRTAISLLELKKTDIVCDLYCGIGTITLCVAKEAGMVVGVETVKEAVENARSNQTDNNIENAEFIEATAEQGFHAICKKHQKIDALIVDPPRAGLEKELINLIINTNIKKMVYISCDVATLARDLKILTENGFEIKYVQPVDMFPRTWHVEVVTLLSRD